jgi:N-acetylmuramoyl-L-alanine amidase
MRLGEVTDCSTYSVRGLDDQILATLLHREPSLLVRVDDLENLTLGKAVHPYLQAPLKSALVSAIAARGCAMQINSALRTIAGQQLLRCHYENGRCGIMAAARPGRSNHNNATAIDIEDADGWRPYLENVGFEWLGSFDPMHFDYTSSSKNIVAAQVKSFQELWSITHPHDKIAIDGDLGSLTLSRLKSAPAEGWYMPKKLGLPSRLMKRTEPVQSGADIWHLQQALIKVGGVRINYDGIFGSDTDRAVKEFQSKQNLVADGIVGKATRGALKIF